VGLSFHCDAFGIKEMVGEKMINSTFGGAVVPEMWTPGAGASKP